MSPLYKIQKDTLEVRRSKSGLGVFSKKDISQGSFIVRYTGKLISVAQADKIGGRYLFQINSKFVVDGRDRKNISRYINHSCRPNCIVKTRKNNIYIHAKKNIIKGEELNYDYGKEYFLEYIRPIGCKCSFCLQKIT